MSSTTVDPVVTCPYEVTHRIRKSVLPYHLARCGKNYSDAEKLQCPFDASHRIDKSRYQEHVLNCTSSGNVKSMQYDFQPKRELGTVPLEFVKTLTVPTMTDWSHEYVPTYDPWKNTEKRNVIRSLIGGSKSRKRKFKKYERRRLQTIGMAGAVRPNFSTSSLVASMRRLSLRDFEALVESIDIRNLFISDRRQVINEMLVWKLKQLVLHQLS